MVGDLSFNFVNFIIEKTMMDVLLRCLIFFYWKTEIRPHTAWAVDEGIYPDDFSRAGDDDSPSLMKQYGSLLPSLLSSLLPSTSSSTNATKAMTKSCADLCGFYRMQYPEDTCQCDLDCVESGDCCGDFALVCPNLAATAQAQRRPKTKCHGFNDLNPNFVGVQTVVGCPKSWSESQVTTVYLS